MFVFWNVCVGIEEIPFPITTEDKYMQSWKTPNPSWVIVSGISIDLRFEKTNAQSPIDRKLLENWIDSIIEYENEQVAIDITFSGIVNDLLLTWGNLIRWVWSLLNKIPSDTL